MRPSLFLLAAPLVPAAIAGGEAAVPKKLTDLIEGKIEFCQNYLGWVTTKKTYTTDYKTFTKTKTDYTKKFTWTVVKKGTKTAIGKKSFVYDVSTETPKPVKTKTTKIVGTKTDYDVEKTTTYTTKTITKQAGHGGKGHGHGKRGWDHRKGPDVRHYKKYHIEAACKKLLKKVYPKTRTYWVTKTKHDKTWVFTTTTETDLKVFTNYKPETTTTYTPIVTIKKTTTLAPKTIVYTDYEKAKTTKTITKVDTKTKYTTTYKKPHYKPKGKGKDGKH